MAAHLQATGHDAASVVASVVCSSKFLRCGALCAGKHHYRLMVCPFTTWSKAKALPSGYDRRSYFRWVDNSLARDHLDRSGQDR